jgi:hypothetical protein
MNKSAMNKRLCALALLLIAAGVAGCGAVQPCTESPYASRGPCSIGKSPTNSGNG